jgi:hypothetical protein
MVFGADWKYFGTDHRYRSVCRFPFIVEYEWYRRLRGTLDAGTPV